MFKPHVLIPNNRLWSINKIKWIEKSIYVPWLFLRFEISGRNSQQTVLSLLNITRLTESNPLPRLFFFGRSGAHIAYPLPVFKCGRCKSTNGKRTICGITRWLMPFSGKYFLHWFANVYDLRRIHAWINFRRIVELFSSFAFTPLQLPQELASVCHCCRMCQQSNHSSLSNLLKRLNS